MQRELKGKRNKKIDNTSFNDNDSTDQESNLIFF